MGSGAFQIRLWLMPDDGSVRYGFKDGHHRGENYRREDESRFGLRSSSGRLRSFTVPL